MLDETNATLCYKIGQFYVSLDVKLSYVNYS
jgi:hypothetical protein